MPQSAQPPRAANSESRHSTTPRTHVHGCHCITSARSLLYESLNASIAAGASTLSARDHHHLIQQGPHELPELQGHACKQACPGHQRNRLQVARAPPSTKVATTPQATTPPRCSPSPRRAPLLLQRANACRIVGVPGVALHLSLQACLCR